MQKEFALPGILLFVLGAIIGVTAQRALAADNRRPHPVDSAPTTRAPEIRMPAPTWPAGLAESIDALSGALASLQTSLERAPSDRAAAGVPQRQALAGTPDTSNDPALVLALQQLTAAIKALPSSPGAAAERINKPLVSTGWINRGVSFAGNGLFDALQSEDESVWEAARATQLQKHMFWDYQDMLSTYGRPDLIETEGEQVYWTYKARIREGIEENYSFVFHSGWVASIGYDYAEL